MKLRYLLLIASLLFSGHTYAQLKAPTSTVKDTIFVVGVEYNQFLLSMEDFPCRYIEESATSFIAAGQEYKKGRKPVVSTESWGSGIQKLIEYPNASVNNTPATVFTIESDERCENPYIILLNLDDYRFIGWRIGTFRASMRQMPKEYQSVLQKYLKVWVSDLPYDELDSHLTDDEFDLIDSFVTGLIKP